MRRDYGSRLFELTDMPFNRSTALDFVAATVDALARWEPRFRVTKVVPTADAEGRFSISVQGQYLPDGVEIFIDGIVVK
ncbi:MAG: hypothetical protein GAK31_00938 [Stenotrophomonas maltophilia]|uniref:IraD/Gp25-like domain-containing protein n=1 Tax=Stenotrophomonas maltophilia TaxID=40324 RepID=A0A7V8FKB4_STEMA|nr:MAG: hypothetical protein GAK31_00938 [Stenotrophomonas maltophilia]